jgi:hypothetical protein
MRLGDRCVGLFGDVLERLTTAVEEGIDRGLSDIFDGEADPKGGGGLLEARETDGLEELRAIPKKEGRGGDGIPKDVSEAAKCHNAGRDLIPVSPGCVLRRGSDSSEAFAGGGDGAGVNPGQGEG